MNEHFGEQRNCRLTRKSMSVLSSVFIQSAGWLAICCKLYTKVLDTLNLRTGKFSLLVVLIELKQFITLSLTLILVQDNCSIEQVKGEYLCHLVWPGSIWTRSFILHDDRLHWALPFHTSFGHLDWISRSKQQQKDETESDFLLQVLIQLSLNFLSLLQIRTYFDCYIYGQ